MSTNPRRTPTVEHEADLYDDPTVYDILHTPGTAWEVGGLERMHRRFVSQAAAAPAPSSPRWLEPACGTGRYLRVAARRGCTPLGFDRSAAMVGYARQRLRPALRRGVFVADMTDFGRRLPARCVDFAFCLINTIRHLPDDASMLAHLRAMARALRPGGVYAVGLSLCSYGREWTTEDVWEAQRGRCHVRQVVQFLPPAPRTRTERVISVLTVARPRGRVQVTSRYTLRSYNTRQWHRLLERSPLCCIGTVDERGRDARIVEPGYGIFILARKKNPRGHPARPRPVGSGTL